MAESPFSDHVIAYLDLLGFRNVVGEARPEALTAILQLLRDIAAERRNFEIETQTAGNARSVSIRPAISSFSDNIVLSFDLDEMRAGSAGVYQALLMFRGTAARIAHRAREFGCLIRGGVTIGHLYHADGVVLGRGLLEAYELESRIAHFPRIVIAEHALKTVQGDRAANAVMFLDDDGYWCLDYATADMEDVDLFGFGAAINEDACAARRAWALSVRHESRRKAAEYDGIGNARAAENWRWFADRFAKSMLLTNPFRFHTNGSPLVFPD